MNPRPVLLLMVPMQVAFGQPRAVVDVRLLLNAASAERTLEVYEHRPVAAGEVTRLRGSRLALAATGMLSGRNLTTDDLRRALDDVRHSVRTEDDPFQMEDARVSAAAIGELLDTIRKRNFAGRVSSTVAQLFPAGARISTVVPLYFVAFGPQHVEAFVQRVAWDGDMPRFVGEGEGELTIVFNLARAVRGGRTIDEQFLGTLSTVAHEVFHAAFGVYQDGSPVWQEYFARRTTALDRLLELTQNEGIAHYLSFEQRGGELPPDWSLRLRDAVGEFVRSAEELRSPNVSSRRSAEILRASNTSEYWKSYGVVTGLMIAREIDRTLGREALAETIALGPDDFYGKYARLAARDGNLPDLGAALPRGGDR